MRIPFVKKIEKKNTYILIVSTLFAVSILIFGILVTLGYSLPDIFLNRGPAIEIVNARPQSVVFVDNMKVDTVKSDGTLLLNGIRSGDHSLLIGSTSVWPWNTTFTAKRGKRIQIAPLQVLRNQKQVPIISSNKLQKTVKEEIEKNREPTRINPLRKNGTLVWVIGTSIHMRDKNNVERTVLSSKTPIRSIIWYRNRSDALLIATKNTVFVLGLHNRINPNYYPIYSGITPIAVSDPSKNDKVFIEDKGKYFSIILN